MTDAAIRDATATAIRLYARENRISLDDALALAACGAVRVEFTEDAIVVERAVTH